MTTIEVKVTSLCKGSRRKHVGRSRMRLLPGESVTVAALVHLILRGGEMRDCVRCLRAIRKGGR